jgi:hypothetical protein
MTKGGVEELTQRLSLPPGIYENTHFEQKFAVMTTLKNIFAMQLRLNRKAKNGRRYTILK